MSQISSCIRRWPLLAVAVILLFGFGASLAAHSRWKADGFFINLATGFVSTLFTVLIVDRLFKHYESRRWQGVDVRVADRLRVMANAAINEMRTCLGFGCEVFRTQSLDPTQMHFESVWVAEFILRPACQSRLPHFNTQQWQRLVGALGRIQANAERILLVLGSRCSPEQQEILLDLQLAANRSTVFYSTFPDVLGVPTEDRTDAEKQSVWCELTAKELDGLLSIAIRLARTLDEPGIALCLSRAAAR